MYWQQRKRTKQGLQRNGRKSSRLRLERRAVVVRRFRVKQQLQRWEVQWYGRYCQGRQPLQV
ncbi:hypothetical protein EC33884_A0189 [Escherichia coli 3.3884]|nr:hypothetical protein EC33884_A0189 [Escherichia coli 3.3884]